MNNKVSIAKNDKMWGVSVKKNQDKVELDIEDAEVCKSILEGRNLISIVSFPICITAIVMYGSLIFFFVSLNHESKCNIASLDREFRFNIEEVGRFQSISALAASAFLMSTLRGVASVYFAPSNQRSSMYDFDKIALLVFHFFICPLFTSVIALSW